MRCALSPSISEFELRDLLGQLRARRFARLVAALEDDLLAVDRILGVRVGLRLLHQARREIHLVGAIALRDQPRFLRRQFVERLGHDRQVGAQNGVVEDHQQIAGLDAGALAHLELGDDAALGMLDLLGVGVDGDVARRDHGARNLRQRRPGAEPAQQAEDDEQSRATHGCGWSGPWTCRRRSSYRLAWLNTFTLLGR